MAALLLLRQGRVAVLKTVLEAPVTRALGSTVSLRAEPGKTDKGPSASPKKQSPPKNVEETLGRPASGPKVLAAKTLVSFPQKDPSPLHSGSRAPRGRGGDPASSSSSSSSSSDSESDEEGDPRDRGRASRPAAPQRSEKGVPRVGASTADTRSAYLSAPEKPLKAVRKSSRDTWAEAPPTPLRVGQESVKRSRSAQTLDSGLGGPHAAGQATSQPRDHSSPRPPPGPQAPPLGSRPKLAEQVAGRMEAAREGVPGAHGGLSMAEQSPGVGPRSMEAAARHPPALDSPQEPAPTPEPFDNSRYRNLQHHEYTVYTFLDVNVQLAGQRLPQPSSGRESPRH